jgi:hypothetical protein
MTSCGCNPHSLPTIEFVGGETQELVFNVYFHSKDKPFGMAGATANFAIVSSLNKTGAPILSKPMTAGYDEHGTVLNVLRVTIAPSESVNLSGKYIYQITLRDMSGETEIPKQGVLFISNNINKSAIASS